MYGFCSRHVLQIPEEFELTGEDKPRRIVFPGDRDHVVMRQARLGRIKKYRDYDAKKWIQDHQKFTDSSKEEKRLLSQEEAAYHNPIYAHHFLGSGMAMRSYPTKADVPVAEGADLYMDYVVFKFDNITAEELENCFSPLAEWPLDTSPKLR